MARNKNALRKHFIQDWKAEDEKPDEKDWLPLAKYISNIEPDNQEETDEEAFYDGDGTLEETTTSIAKAYNAEGYYDPEDEAQELIADKELELGDGRKVWHRVVRADGKKEWVGRATLSDIVAGGGEASDYEKFSCTIRYDHRPKVEDVSNGDGGNDGGDSGE